MYKGNSLTIGPGYVSQSIARLTQEPEVSSAITHTCIFVSPSADSRRAVVSYWRSVNEVLVNRLGSKPTQ